MVLVKFGNGGMRIKAVPNEKATASANIITKTLHLPTDTLKLTHGGELHMTELNPLLAFQWRPCSFVLSVINTLT